MTDSQTVYHAHTTQTTMTGKKAVDSSSTFSGGKQKMVFTILMNDESKKEFESEHFSHTNVS